MKIGGDGIDWEARYEIDETIKALNNALAGKTDDDDERIIQHMINLLDVLYLSW